MDFMLAEYRVFMVRFSNFTFMVICFQMPKRQSPTGICEQGYFFCLAAPFFLTAARLGPLRVRALVLVRWPRTGNDLRCRNPR
jgi:hypothetical protein